MKRCTNPRACAGAECLSPLLFCAVLASQIFLAGCGPGPRPPGHALPGRTPVAEPQSQTPFFEARSQRAVYEGPGREDPTPEGLDEIKIGWFGPADGKHPTAGMMWQAATLAVEDANRQGGPGGLPFRLVVRWSENPWAGGAGNATRLAYDDRVWAIVGAPDGASSHIVEQVIAQARLPFVSPVSTDKTANLVNVPWIFSCAPGDHIWAPVLARAIESTAGARNMVILAGTGHDSRVGAKALLAALDEVGVYAKHRLDFAPGDRDFGEELSILSQADPAVVAVVAGPEHAARLVTALRPKWPELPIFGDPRMGQRLFAISAGPAAEGVRFPLLWNTESCCQPGRAFAVRFAERFGSQPDYTAAYTYDAVTLLTAAVRQAGLNRARIRDALRELSGFAGITGAVNWDPTGQNTRPVSLGTIRDGKIVG